MTCSFIPLQFQLVGVWRLLMTAGNKCAFLKHVQVHLVILVNFQSLCFIHKNALLRPQKSLGVVIICQECEIAHREREMPTVEPLLDRLV